MQHFFYSHEQQVNGNLMNKLAIIGCEKEPYN